MWKLATVVILGAGLSWQAEQSAQLWADTSNGPGEEQPETWNWHVQNTDIMQGYPAFHAKYSGTNSLPTGGQIRQTVSVDVYAGIRLWSGAEAHIDGTMWQGFGLHGHLWH
jgi:high affinity Mn2+ porin